MTGNVDEFTELVDGSFPRVDLVGKSANGVHRFLVAKSTPTDGAHGIVEAAVVRDLVNKSSKELPVTDDVTKAGDLDASETFVGDPNQVVQPGSPEWEKVDADTANKWVGILARAKMAVEALATRESAEVFADNGDGDAIWSLEDACCAIDAAITSLAPYAAGEQVEADAEEMKGVFKAASSLEADPFPLAPIERFNTLFAAGRGLSTEVRKQFQSAVADLGKKLAELPLPEGSKMTDTVTKAETATPPVAGTTQAEIMAGQTGQSSPNGNPEQVEANEGDAVVPAAENNPPIPTDVKTLSGLAGSAEDTTGSDAMVGDGVVDVNTESTVAKAAPQQAVYDSSGNLLGTVDPSKITELISESGADAAATPEAAAGTAEPAAPAMAAGDDTAAAEMVADSGTDAGDVGTDTTSGAPAPAAAPAPADADTSDKVAKSEIDEVVKARLAEMDVVPASVVKALEDRLNEFLEAPAKSRVLSHGATPPARVRGMDQVPGGSPVDVAKSAELRERFDNARTMEERETVEKEMNQSAIEEYNRLRGAQPGGLGSLVQ